MKKRIGQWTEFVPPSLIHWVDNTMKRVTNNPAVTYKSWMMRWSPKAEAINVEGKITIFKTLAIFKIIHLSLATIVPMEIINGLKKTQKEFVWNRNNSKIKHSTLCNKSENVGLKIIITMLLDKTII